MLIFIEKISLSRITQQIQIRVQDVFIDELSIHWEIRLFPGNSKLNENYLTVVCFYPSRMTQVLS